LLISVRPKKIFGLPVATGEKPAKGEKLTK